MIYLGKEAVGMNNIMPDFETMSRYCNSLILVGNIPDLLPDFITVDLNNMKYFSIPQDWNIDSGLQILNIKCDKYLDFYNSPRIDNTTVDTKVNITTYANRGIKVINFINGCKPIGQLNGFFAYLYDLEEINGDIDFSNIPSTQWTYSNWFLGDNKLKNIRVTPNSLNVNGSFQNLPLINDESVVSIANGCSPNVEGKTLTLHSSVKTRCNTLMGNNIDGLFVADENGTMTLSDFITNVKGWTLS